jgi:hypothetical protein
MVNTRVCKTLNDSSSLSLPLFCIAQLVEQWPFKPPVLGSSPSAIINTLLVYLVKTLLFHSKKIGSSPVEGIR